MTLGNMRVLVGAWRTHGALLRIQNACTRNVSTLMPWFGPRMAQCGLIDADARPN